jgi:IS5 family transposase
MRLRDVLGPVFTDTQFAGLFPSRGKPGLSPAVLMLVVVLQFVEGLSDRQAAHAVAARIDWKYALGLDLADTGFDYSVLCEFRDRLLAGDAGQQVLDTVLAAARAAGLVKTAGRARTDSTHVVAAIREVNRLELVGETLRAALNAIAVVAPDWLALHADPDWFDRYAYRVESYRLPAGTGKRAAWAVRVGVDGMRVLQMVFAATDEDTVAAGLAGLPEVEVLRRVWVAEFQLTDGVVVLRDPKDRPPAGIRLVSPYDLDARTGGKRALLWDGYKVHLTETCEPDTPHLITNVATTPATVTDFEMTASIHTDLAGRDLLPDTHLVDTGYVTADNLVTARATHQVELLGPVMPDTAWQTVAGQGFAATDFTIDWDTKRLTCPQGRTSTRWSSENNNHGIPIIKVRFAPSDCRPCPSRALCTRASSQGRNITLHPRPQHEALHHARAQQRTPAWQQRYEHRAGVEGTLSQAVRGFGLRDVRYRGLAKTGLQHHLTATALNLVRIDAWQTGVPLARTRTSRFATLNPTA